MSVAVWRFIVRPIAVGGMLVGAAYTLYGMRKSLTAGLGKAFSDLRQTAEQQAKLSRTERYMSSKAVFGLIALMFVLMCFLYIHISGLVWPAVLAAVVMLLSDFSSRRFQEAWWAFIGSSNNPVSGLTLSTLIIAALLMVSLGVSGTPGVAAVLGVAAVVCVFGISRRRTFAGLQGWLHPWRHAAHHSDRGTDRGCRSQPGHVFPADAAA